MDAVRFRPAALYALVLAAFVASACSSSEVGDFAGIFESEPEVLNITSNAARVKAITNVDMACAIAYGPTTEYGSLATDLDMAGGGHRNHGPLLTGLQPDTTYHFTFGGIGPDGTVYRGEDMTFRTGPAEADASGKPAGRNIALSSLGAKVIGTSSNYGDDEERWGGGRAIDGDLGSQWSSNGDGDDAWIEIELPAETRVTALGFWTRTMGTSAEISSFRVVSDRGEVRGPFRLAGPAAVHYFETDLTAKGLRFEAVESNGGNTGAVEIEVYGEPAR